MENIFHQRDYTLGATDPGCNVQPIAIIYSQLIMDTYFMRVLHPHKHGKHDVIMCTLGVFLDAEAM